MHITPSNLSIPASLSLLLPLGQFASDSNLFCTPAAVSYHALLWTAFSPSHVHLLSAAPKPWQQPQPQTRSLPLLCVGGRGVQAAAGPRGQLAAVGEEAPPLLPLFTSALPLAKSWLATQVGCPRGSAAAWAALRSQTTILSVWGEQDQTGVLGGPVAAKSQRAGSRWSGL